MFRCQVYHEVYETHGVSLFLKINSQASRFRSLAGTMTPPDQSSQVAEIIVEGKRKQVDSFVRWCQKSDVGLSQVISVSNVLDEEPTGLYDDFYVATK